MGPGYFSWRTRGTDDWLLILTVSGGGLFGSASSSAISTEPGDLTLIRPGTRHDYRTDPAIGKWELLWAHFYPKPFWNDLLRWPEASPGLMKLSSSRVEKRFFDVHRYASSGMERFAMNALEEVLLWCSLDLPEGGGAVADDRVRSVLDVIQRRLAEKLSLTDLAEVVGLSPSRMSALFREQFGMTPIQYLEIQRISRAKQLLVRTTMPIYAIAAETGFENPFYFTLRFKKHEGVSPTDWRKSSGE